MAKSLHYRLMARTGWIFYLIAVVALFGVGCREQGAASSEPSLVFGERGFGPGQFDYPRAMALGPDGKLFIVDKTARIQRFDTAGRFETQWQMPEFQAGKPTGIWVGPDGRVYVADTHYHQVIIFDGQGNELHRFGQFGEGPGQFIYPTAVLVGPDRNIYVSEYGGNDRINVFDKDYTYMRSFGDRDAGRGSLLRPQDMEIDGQGRLWVADAIHHRICCFDPQGELLSTIGQAGSGPGELRYPYDLTFDEQGCLWVAEFGNNRIQRFDQQGKSLLVWGQAGRAVGQLAYPWGVVMGPDQRLFVLDSGNCRVQVLTF